MSARPPHLDARTVLGAATAEFSTVIEWDRDWVVADRTMMWDTATGYGSHAERGIAAASTLWYLAEGATHSGFDLFYLVQNPNTTDATVEVTYLLPGGAPPVVESYPVPANSRFNIWVNAQAVVTPQLANTDVSAIIRSTNLQPIIVERAMYLNSQGQTFGSGHESAGITTPATGWFFAEGSTGPYFDLFVLIANPNGATLQVRAEYLLPSGTVVTRTYTVAANSRFNIWVDLEDALLADTAVSTTLTSLNGVTFIAERAMWWPGAIATWHEAHNSAGSVGPAGCWGLAEGEQGGPGNRQTFILIANTAAVSSSVNVQLVFEGGGTSTRTFTVAPKSRFNVDVGVEFPAAAGRRFGALVGCFNVGPDLVVERAMYSNAAGVVWAAGTNALATPFP